MTKDGEVIAENTTIIENPLKKARRLILDFNPPDALILKNNRQKTRYIHNYLVPYPLHILYINKNNKINKKCRLPAWRGTTKGKAQKIIETPKTPDNKKTIQKTNTLQPNDKIKIKQRKQ